MRKKGKDLVSREEFIYAFQNLKIGMELLNKNQFVLLEKEKNRAKPFNFNGGSAM